MLTTRPLPAPDRVAVPPRKWATRREALDALAAQGVAEIISAQNRLVWRYLLHPTVERISDADPIPGLQRLQLQIERLITVHADRAVTDPVVTTYLEVVADLERQDGAQ